MAMVKVAGVASCILLLVATVSIVLGRSGGRNTGHPCRYLTITNTRTNLKQRLIQRQGRNTQCPNSGRGGGGGKQFWNFTKKVFVLDPPG